MKKMILRVLNDDGIQRFAEFLNAGYKAGHIGKIPRELLKDDATSEVFGDQQQVTIDRFTFEGKYDLGSYLNAKLGAFEATKLYKLKGLWSGLSLLWLDFLCRDVNGKLVPLVRYSYIPSDDYKYHYRHIVRLSWQLVYLHQDKAKLLLHHTGKGSSQIYSRSDLYEQFAARQHLISSNKIISLADMIYYDKYSEQPRAGITSLKGGSIRRLAAVLRQLDLTYDIEGMDEESIVRLLPKEFDRWKNIVLGQRNGK